MLYTGNMCSRSPCSTSVPINMPTRYSSSPPPDSAIAVLTAVVFGRFFLRRGRDKRLFSDPTDALLVGEAAGEGPADVHRPGPQHGREHAPPIEVERRHLEPSSLSIAALIAPFAFAVDVAFAVTVAAVMLP